MPHLTLEYSANIRPSANMPALCARLADCLAAQRDGGKVIYALGAIRVRALSAEEFHIADGRQDAAFVHAILKIGAGRGEAVKQATGDALFAVMKDHFASLYASMGLALSLEISEFSEAGTWKHNNLHARLR